MAGLLSLFLASAASAEEFFTVVYPSGSTDIRIEQGEVIELMTLHYQSAAPEASLPVGAQHRGPSMRVTTGYATVHFQVLPMIQEQLEGRRRFYIAGPALVSFVDVTKPSTLLVTYRSFPSSHGDH